MTVDAVTGRKKKRKKLQRKKELSKKERKFDKMPVVRIMRLTKRFEEADASERILRCNRW